MCATSCRHAASMLQACCKCFDCHAANALTVHPRVQMLILTSALLQTGTTCEKISRTNPEMEQPMQEDVGAQLVLEYVDAVLPLALSRTEHF